MPDRNEMTQTLIDSTRGSASALNELFESVYGELRRIAQAYLNGERPGHTLQATALVHEAYVRLIDQTQVEWENRAHFLAIAAQAMRRVLVDHARRRGRIKRGGGRETLSIENALTVADAEFNTDLIGLDDALRRLSIDQPDKARVVELRFFGGMSYEEIAAVFQVTPRTVIRHWKYAQAWLYRAMVVNPTED